MTADKTRSSESRGNSDAIESLNDLLSNTRRRYLLYSLVLYANPVKLADVADQVAVWEHTDLPDVYERERHQIYNSLYHDHLPVLCDAGLVDYHQEDDMIELSSAAARVEPYVKWHLEDEIDDLLRAEGQSIAHGDW